MDKIKFLVCGNVKAPQRKAGQDAGFDFFVPDYTPDIILGKALNSLYALYLFSTQTNGVRTQIFNLTQKYLMYHILFDIFT